jgi:hypothetical protein
VAPENIRWMLQLTAPRIASSMKSRDAELGVTGEFCAAAFRIVEKALEGGRHLTREELTAVMKQNRIKVDSARMYHLLMHAELAGLTCSGAIRGKEHTYALLEERATEAVTLARDEALGRLAMTYFTGHGPATLHDFAWWSGLSAANARQGLESAKPALVSEKYGDRTYWTADASGNFIDGDNNPVRLLPAFDEYIIGYRDRSATLAEENHGKAISGNGIFRPVVIKHGQAIGIWKKNVSKSGTITANLFAPVDKTTQEQIGEAEKGFRRFTGQIAM